MPIAKGQVLLSLDKGYCDHNWWYQIHCFQEGLLSSHDSRVTPVFKPRGVDRSLLDSPAKRRSGRSPWSASNIAVPAAKRINRVLRPTPFRQRKVGSEKTSRPRVGVLATNDLERQPTSLPKRYKARWGIELFLQMAEAKKKKKKTLLGGKKRIFRKFFGPQRKLPSKCGQIFTALITYLFAANETRHSVLHSSVLAPTA